MNKILDDEQEKLVAAIIKAENRLPGGYQVGMGVRLDQAIEAVEKLFAEHELPMRDQLIGELRVWRCHIEEGVQFMENSYRVLQMLIQSASAPRRGSRNPHT